MNGGVELAKAIGSGSAVYGFPSHEHQERGGRGDSILRIFTARGATNAVVRGGTMANLAGTPGKIDLRSTVRCGRGMGRKRRRRRAHLGTQWRCQGN
jgi:hypothetical protein